MDKKLNFGHKSTLPSGKLSNCLHSVNYCICNFTSVDMFAYIGNKKLLEEEGEEIPLQNSGHIKRQIKGNY